jgi:hypothetical protein
LSSAGRAKARLLALPDAGAPLIGADRTGAGDLIGDFLEPAAHSDFDGMLTNQIMPKISQKTVSRIAVLA